MAPTANTKANIFQGSVSIKTPATSCHVLMQPAVSIPPGKLEMAPLILQSVDLGALIESAAELVKARLREQDERNRQAQSARARFAAD